MRIYDENLPHGLHLPLNAPLKALRASNLATLVSCSPGHFLLSHPPGSAGRQRLQTKASQRNISSAVMALSGSVAANCIPHCACYSIRPGGVLQVVWNLSRGPASLPIHLQPSKRHSVSTSAGWAPPSRVVWLSSQRQVAVGLCPLLLPRCNSCPPPGALAKSNGTISERKQEQLVGNRYFGRSSCSLMYKHSILTTAWKPFPIRPDHEPAQAPNVNAESYTLYCGLIYTCDSKHHTHCSV